LSVPISTLYSIFKENSIICIDSRKVESGCIFFALKGDNVDGNKYASQAIADGASYAVIDDKDMLDGGQMILVEDVLETLQQLATYHREQLKIPLICITGTNGKTTTKELTAKVLSKKFNTIATLGNFNNHLGVPLSILRISSETEVAVIELGANHVGEIDFLCGIAQPTHGLITNIGKAHLEGFGDLEGVKEAKSELYKYLQKNGGKAFVNYDNEMLRELAGEMNVVSYGTASGCTCQGTLVSVERYLQLSYHLEEGAQDVSKINSQLMGAYNFENVLAAICIGSFFQVPAAGIVAAIEDYVPNNSRSQEIQTATNHVIMDAYNANPMNMRAALESFSGQVKSERAVILGDMLELGSYAQEEHRAIVEYLIAQSYDRVILVGEAFSKVSSMLRCENFATVKEARTWLESFPINGMTILVKGSRGIGLEALLDKL